MENLIWVISGGTPFSHSCSFILFNTAPQARNEEETAKEKNKRDIWCECLVAEDTYLYYKVISNLFLNYMPTRHCCSKRHGMKRIVSTMLCNTKTHFAGEREVFWPFHRVIEWLSKTDKRMTKMSVCARGSGKKWRKNDGIILRNLSNFNFHHSTKDRAFEIDISISWFMCEDHSLKTKKHPQHSWLHHIHKYIQIRNV